MSQRETAATGVCWCGALPGNPCLHTFPDSHHCQRNIALPTIPMGGVAQSYGEISNTPSRQAKGRARSQAEVAGSTPVAAHPSPSSQQEDSK